MKKNFSYLSIAEAVYKDFILNKLNIGDPLPTEQELIRHYKVSRTTVRRGIQKLVEDDLIYTIQGSGSFIKGKKQDWQTSNLISFCEQVRQAGAIPSAKVLEFKIIEASEDIAEILKIETGTPVYKTKRLRYLDKIPKQVEVSFLPVSLFPDFSVDTLLGSKYKYIEETKKMRIENNRLIIEPFFLDADTAQLLETQANIPTLCVKSIGFLDNGAVFEYSEMIENSNKYDLSFNVMREEHYS